MSMKFSSRIRTILLFRLYSSNPPNKSNKYTNKNAENKTNKYSHTILLPKTTFPLRLSGEKRIKNDKIINEVSTHILYK